MRSFRWLIITGAVIIGVAVVAIAVGALWLNSFIHSAAFKDDVQQRAAQTLGGPVTIEAIDFDVLHGVKLRGLVTQIDANHTGGQGALKVSVAQANLTYSVWELLSGKLHVTGVALDQPQVTLTKQATPSMPPSAATPSTASPSGTITVAPGTSVPFQFTLDSATVNDGAVTIQDAGGATVVQLKGLNATADTAGFYAGKDITGTLKIAQVSASGLQLTSFSTPFTYRTNNLTADPFSASAFSGKIAGSFQLDGSSASVLTVNANGLNVEQLAAATSSGSGAHLTGSLDLQSKWRGVETGALNGEGDAQLTGGKLQNVKILQQASQLLRVNELNEPVITKAQTHFLVQNQQTNFTGLQVDSPVFKITGNGTVGFDGALNADLVLVLSSSAMGKLPKQAAASFVQQPDGTGSIQFHVSGTTSNPQTDLPQRLILQNTQIKNAINKALNKFFH